MSARLGRAMRGPVIAGLVLGAVLSAAPRQAAGQPALNVTFGRALNALSSADAVSADDRRTTGAAIEAEQMLAGDRLRVFYTLEAGDYSTPGDWRFYENMAGATWQAKPERSKSLAVFTGMDFLWRKNGSAWEAADYRALGFFLNAEWKPATTRTLRAGYRADIRAFPEMPELDQVEHGGFGSVLVNVQSRTTLIGEVRAGAKLYEVVGIAVDSADVPEAGPAPSAGLSRGRGPGSRGSLQPTPAHAGGGTVGGTAGQLTFLGRVAQSVTARTGVTFQYSERRSFGALPTAVVTTPALFFDDGVYDDPFASNAASARFSLKRALANGMALSGSGVWVRKDYRGTLALDEGGLPLAGAPLRADRIWQAGAAWAMPVLAERTGPVGLELVVNYMYTRHRSNDAFYNYSSHAVGFSVGVGY